MKMSSSLCCGRMAGFGGWNDRVEHAIESGRMVHPCESKVGADKLQTARLRR